MLQTDLAYHKVRPVAKIDHNNGRPDSGQNSGTAPNYNNSTQYTLDSVTVRFGPFTSFIIGTFALAYSPER